MHICVDQISGTYTNSHVKSRCHVQLSHVNFLRVRSHNGRVLSTLRHFYRTRLRGGAIAEDPTLLLDAPKLPRALPKALSETQIDSLKKGGRRRTGR